MKFLDAYNHLRSGQVRECGVCLHLLNGLDVLVAVPHTQRVAALLAIEVGKLLHVECFIKESVAQIDVTDLCVAPISQVWGDVRAVG